MAKGFANETKVLFNITARCVVTQTVENFSQW